VQQHLGRLDGVAKVDVSLKNGRVVIYPKSDATLDPTRILKETYDSGVSPVEMTMTASGRLIRDPQKGLMFQTAAKQSFEVVPNDLSSELEGRAGNGAQVTLRGRLFKKPPGKQKPSLSGLLRFVILEVVKKD
jgi:hypothetical protein